MVTIAFQIARNSNQVQQGTLSNGIIGHAYAVQRVSDEMAVGCGFLRWHWDVFVLIKPGGQTEKDSHP